MNKIRLAAIPVLSMVFITAAVHTLQTRPPAETEGVVSQSQVEQSFGQLPLLFVENQGQWDAQVAYAVQGSDKTLYFTAEGVTFALTAPTAGEDEKDGREEIDVHNWNSKPVRSKRWAVKLDFLGANPDARPVGQEQDEAVISYFKGQPEEWHAGLTTYRRLVYTDLWPGVDLVYEGTVNRLKYHFVVHPGADPDQIRLAYRGASDVTLNDAGQLVVTTPVGSFEDDTPVAYQEVDGERVLVAMAYALETAGADSQPYHFALGDYDPSLPLILDPVILVYAGYIGGVSGDYAEGIAVDGTGNAYIVGKTASNQATFPVTTGPDLTYNGLTDAFIAKVNSAGTGLLYASYIGGNDLDIAYDIAVDDAGNAYITGRTESSQATFPVTVGPDLTYNGGPFGDAFVVKVNSAGSGLVYAGYIGGENSDWGDGIAVDAAGNAYITGPTESDEATFPVTIGPDLTYNGGSWDAFVVKVNSTGTGLDYAGYIGGNSNEYGYSIAVDGANQAYITGNTISSELTFPVTVGPDLTHNGEGDTFIAKVNSAGSGLVYAGYVGGASYETGYDIAVDGTGSAYITGVTDSSEATFPVTVGPDLTYSAGDGDVFVAKINSAGDGLVYAGYIGGGEYEVGDGIAVDTDGNAYIVGFTSSGEASFPVAAGPDLTYNGLGDAFVAKVNPAGTGLVYAGYIGGSDYDGGLDIALDGFGNAYVGGTTGSGEMSFPVTDGPDLTHNGGWDAFVAKVALVDIPEVTPEALTIDGLETGLAGAAYVFTATTAPVSTTLPLTYSWQAAGQQPVTHTSGLTDTAVFTWSVSGPQPITVTAWNTVGMVTETHLITLYEPVSADFVGAPLSGTAPLTVTFTNLSDGEYDSCLWDFGDEGGSNACAPGDYIYQMPGFYTVTLTISGLGGTDTLTRTDYLSVYEPVQADFAASPTSGYPPLLVTFTNLSSGDFTGCFWDLGDGSTSSDCNLTNHLYSAPGMYTVALTVSGPGGTDTMTLVGLIEAEDYRVYLPVVLKP